MQVEVMPRLIGLECMDFNDYLISQLQDMLNKAFGWSLPPSMLLSVLLDSLTTLLVYKWTVLDRQSTQLPGLQAEGAMLTAGRKMASRNRVGLLLILQLGSAILRRLGWGRKVLALLGIANLIRHTYRGGAPTWTMLVCGLNLSQQKGSVRSFDLSAVHIGLLQEGVECLVREVLPSWLSMIRSGRMRALFKYGGSIFTALGQEEQRSCEVCGSERMAMERQLDCGHVMCHYCWGGREECPVC